MCSLLTTGIFMNTIPGFTFNLFQLPWIARNLFTNLHWTLAVKFLFQEKFKSITRTCLKCHPNKLINKRLGLQNFYRFWSLSWVFQKRIHFISEDGKNMAIKVFLSEGPEINFICFWSNSTTGWEQTAGRPGRPGRHQQAGCSAGYQKPHYFLRNKFPEKNIAVSMPRKL